MRDSRYRLRAFGPADVPAQTGILNRLTPDRPTTVEQVRFEDEYAHTPPMVCRQLAVDEVATGRMVASGGVVTPPDGIGLGNFWVGVGVDPDHQGRGIGRDLSEVLDAVANEVGARRLWASARIDEPRALRFLQMQGFAEKLRNWESCLDVSTGAAIDTELGPLPPAEGVEFTTLAEEGPDDATVIDRVYALAAAAMAEIPRMGPYVPLTREQFVGMMMRGPGFLPKAFFLARAGGRYVGMSNLERVAAEPDTLNLLLTATAPDFRRKGVALELKRRGIRFAKERGYRAVRTWNDSLNHRIWAINERLGYRRERETIWAEKLLSTSAGPTV